MILIVITIISQMTGFFIISRKYLNAANEVLVSYAQTKFDDDGKLVDEPTVQFIDLVMKNFVEYYERLKK